MRLLIEERAPEIGLAPTLLSRERLLAALAMVESSGGRDLRFRFERSFYRGGAYFDRDPNMQERMNRWEAGVQDATRDCAAKLTACSFGPWQILYTTAAELGFDRAPWELADPRTNAYFAVRLINRRIIPRLPEEALLGEESAVKGIADGYNSGNPNDRHIPVAYMARVWQYYQDPRILAGLAQLPDYVR